MPGLILQLLSDEFAVCRLAPDASVPAWADATPFVSITRTTDELSIICRAASVPAGVHAERGWCLLKLAGPFPFDAVGILASVLDPLAAAGIGVLAFSTFETDYVFVKAAHLAPATHALTVAGHTITEPPMPCR
jgi:hypothetical protein